MAIFFGVLLNALIVGTTLAYLVAVIWLSWQTEDPLERVRRILAMLTGILVVVLANAAGLTFPHALVTAVSSTRPTGTIAKVFAFLVPGGVGVGMGWYLLYVYRRRPALAARVLAFVGVLAAAALAGIYAAAASTKGVKLGATAIPNIAFAAGLGFFLIFGNERKSPSHTGPLSGIVRSLLRSRDK